MKTKKLMSVLLAGAMLVSAVPAMAQYENVEILANPLQNPAAKTIEGTVTTDPTERTFTFDGSTYTLLDTDADGNYLVIAPRVNGVPWWSSNLYDLTFEDLEVIADGDTTTYKYTGKTYEQLGGQALSDAIRFNPEVEGTMGYYLNNDYYNSMPSLLKSNLVKKTWVSEEIKMCSNANWTNTKKIEALDTEENPIEGRDGYYVFNNIAGQGHNIAQSSAEAYIAIPSYSEYMAYKDKIGVSARDSWFGMSLRTVSMGVNLVGTYGTKIVFSPLKAVGTVNGWNGGRQLFWEYGQPQTDARGYIRPIFWLKADFFKNVKIENPGADVISDIKAKCSYKDLATAGYTDAEIEAMGIEVGPVRPRPIIDPFAGYVNDVPVQKFGVGTNAWGAQVGTAVATDGASPIANTFNVKSDDGTASRRFILLDRDSEGNYLVLADENYGTHRFTTADMATVNSASAKDEDWTFDPTDEKSVAYWLNNDFLANGNGSALPTALKNEILGVKEGTTDPSWKVEAKYVWKQNGATPDETWLANIDGERTINAAVVLPSYSEIVYYKSKIGGPAGVSWNGAGTRTVNARVSYNSNTQANTYTNYIFKLGENTSGGVATGKFQMQYDGSLTAEPQNMRIRPMFWLDKDFFKNVKVDTDAILAGGNVANQIMQYNIADIEALYETKAERDAIGYDEANLPSANNLRISGIPAVGTELTVRYDFTQAQDAEEKGTQIQWYIADSADGDFAAIEGATAAAYTVKESDDGKYLKAVVIPKDDLNGIGRRVSTPVVHVSTEELLTINYFDGLYGSEEGYDNYLDTLNGATYVRADVYFTNNGADTNKALIIAVYDASGKMVKMNSKVVTVEAGAQEKAYSIGVTTDAACGADYTAKAMVWDTLDGMAPMGMQSFPAAE